MRSALATILGLSVLANLWLFSSWDDSKQALAAASQTVADQKQVIGQLETQRAANQRQLARLSSQQGEIRSQLIDQRQRFRRQLEEVNSEFEEYKAWASRQLPDAVIRLRERPAITGASAYQQWLSTDSALPVAAEPSDD